MESSVILVSIINHFLKENFINYGMEKLESIKQAQQNARQAGVADRIVFHLASAEEAPLNPPL
jgi:23S rRNA G2445 N2-methylase RlmL